MRKLSGAQRVVGGKPDEFSPWNTRLIYGGLLVIEAASCENLFIYFPEEVLSLEKANWAESCSAGEDVIHQLTRQGHHPFSHNGTPTHSFQK